GPSRRRDRHGPRTAKMAMAGGISGRGAGSGQLRTAERVAKWRTRPQHATQALGGHGVTAGEPVRHRCREVANSPRTLRPPPPPAPPRGEGPAMAHGHSQKAVALASFSKSLV